MNGRTIGGAIATITLLGATMLGAGSTGPAAAARPAAPRASTVSQPLITMIRALPVAAHSHAASYDRASEYGDEYDYEGDAEEREPENLSISR